MTLYEYLSQANKLYYLDMFPSHLRKIDGTLDIEGCFVVTSNLRFTLRENYPGQVAVVIKKDELIGAKYHLNRR